MDATDIGQAMANMRDRFAPEPHAEGAKRTVCESCSEPFWQWERQYNKRCSACGARRSAESVTASMNKQGPGWEKVVRGQLRRWIEEARKLGITPET